MSDLESLRDRHALALRLAGQATDPETREALLAIAEQYLREAAMLEGKPDDARDEPPDEPPLPAT